jgi:hypothetical protein
MLPRVQPIAPVRRKQPFDDPEWLFDLKYERLPRPVLPGTGALPPGLTNGNWMSRFADLGDRIAASLDVEDAILDGEIIAADETGHCVRSWKRASCRRSSWRI